jgi:hypothetical protein
MDLRSLSAIRERLVRHSLSRRFPSKSVRSIDRNDIVHFSALALVLIVAVGLRLWGLDRLGFNTDEAVYCWPADFACPVAGWHQLKRTCGPFPEGVITVVFFEFKGGPDKLNLQGKLPICRAQFNKLRYNFSSILGIKPSGGI